MCIRSGSIDEFRRAIELTCTLWGGRFNPIIPVDESNSAAKLIGVHQPDALFAVGGDPVVHRFIAQFPHLMWPASPHGLFSTSFQGIVATFCDATMAARYFAGSTGAHDTDDEFVVRCRRWGDADPLADLLLAERGRYPNALNGRR
jgi:hypothetical protein